MMNPQTPSHHGAKTAVATPDLSGLQAAMTAALMPLVDDLTRLVQQSSQAISAEKDRTVSSRQRKHHSKKRKHLTQLPLQQYDDVNDGPDIPVTCTNLRLPNARQPTTLHDPVTAILTFNENQVLADVANARMEESQQREESVWRQLEATQRKHAIEVNRLQSQLRLQNGIAFATSIGFKQLAGVSAYLPLPSQRN